MISKRFNLLEQVEAKEEEQEQAEQEVESKKEPYIYYILSFPKLADLVAFAKTVTFEMETSELYKMNERYYLTILVDIENHPSPYPAWLLARMREFADDSDISRSVLRRVWSSLDESRCCAQSAKKSDNHFWKAISRL